MCAHVCSHMHVFCPSNFSSQLSFCLLCSKHVGLTTLHVGLAMIHAWFGSLCFALFALLLLSSFDVGILFCGSGGEQVNSEEKLKRRRAHRKANVNDMFLIIFVLPCLA